MKAFIQTTWTHLGYNYATAPALAFYMKGSVPTDKDSLIAALPQAGIPGLLESCVGLGLLLCTRYRDENKKIRSKYIAFSDNLSMLKRGSVPFTSNSVTYHYPMPSKAYREDGKSGLWWMPPTLFAFPISRSNVFGAPISPQIRTPNVRVKEEATDSISTASYIVEYVDATTISALFTGASESRGGIGPTTVSVEYWSGSSWVSVLDTNYRQDAAVAFTAVTSTKFRVTLRLSSSTTSVVTRLGGIALLHTVAKSTVSIADTISWVAITPMPDIETSMSNPIYLNSRLLPYRESDVRLNSLLSEAGAMDILSNRPPMVIDTCGASASTAKALITKDSALVAGTDRPSILMYDYTLGDLSC